MSSKIRSSKHIIILLFSLFLSGLVENQTARAGTFFLRPPFNTNANGSTNRLTSYFDHQQPNYGTDTQMVIYNGENVADGDPYGYDGHPGYDWGIAEGTEIVAAADGVVIHRIISNTGYGNHICIRHPDGYYTLYAHLSDIIVSYNSQVTSGQVIGHSGNTGHSTGPHLHFGVYTNESDCLYESENSATDPFGWTGDYPDPLIIYEGKSATCLWRSSSEDPISCADTIFEDKGRYSSVYGSWSWDAYGNGYHRYYSRNTDETVLKYAAWDINHLDHPFPAMHPFPAIVYAYIPETNATTTNAIYQFWTANGWQTYVINQQANPNRWVSLGSYLFNPGEDLHFYLLADTQEPINSTYVSADGIKFRTYNIYLPIVMTPPTTETFYADTADAELIRNNYSTWNTTRNATSANNIYTGFVDGTMAAYFTTTPNNLYGINRLFTFFDTSSIPSEATIISAEIHLYAGPYQHGSNQIHIVDTWANLPLGVNDYSRLSFISGGTFISPPTNSWIVIPFNSTGLTWIMKGSITKLALINNFDLTNTAPTGQNDMDISMGEDTTYRPYLVVSYTLP